MPMTKEERLAEYYANHNHPVGSEAWLDEYELETNRSIEELEDPNNPRNSKANKEARERKLQELMGKPVQSYKDTKG